MLLVQDHAARGFHLHARQSVAEVISKSSHGARGDLGLLDQIPRSVILIIEGSIRDDFIVRSRHERRTRTVPAWVEVVLLERLAGELGRSQLTGWIVGERRSLPIVG